MFSCLPMQETAIGFLRRPCGSKMLRPASGGAELCHFLLDVWVIRPFEPFAARFLSRALMKRDAD
jgi:hypothetical protein